jgi:fumarylacetoacetase
MSTLILDKLPFTLQCLPYGVISTADSEPRCAVAIGDHAIDLLEYAHSGRLETVSEAFGDIEFDDVFGQVRPSKIRTTNRNRKKERTSYHGTRSSTG